MENREYYCVLSASLKSSDGAGVWRGDRRQENRKRGMNGLALNFTSNWTTNGELEWGNI